MASSSGGSDDPWFRVGEYGIGTTVLVIGMGLFSMIIWAIEGPARSITKFFMLASRGTGGSVLGGQLWRLFTWPIPNAPGFWILLMFVIFFMLGTQMEAVMGRRRFTIYLLGLTVIPAMVVTLLDLLFGIEGISAGLRFIEIGVLIAFAMFQPNARFMFGIPAWGVAIGIVVLDILQLLGGRTPGALAYPLTMLVAVVLTAMFLSRAMGFAEEVTWLPKLPLPVSLGGTGEATGPVASGRAGSGRGRRGRRSGKSKLKAVPPIDPVQDGLADMEIDSLLDQVASDGLDSLTKEQRKRLEQHSKRLRKRDDS